MKKRKLHIGLRTVKTAVAIIIAMILVEPYGATSSRLIYAMLGAMAAVQPTFRESLETCVSQTVGVLAGIVMGLILLWLPTGPLASVLIGVILIIALYNMFYPSASPSLPCFIFVMTCTDA
ncbi:MAG: FUSC family protein, partial [Oscillospiraceae bacterium]|nr:FUSC family protein [Oscillospiraceae bacterium]